MNKYQDELAKLQHQVACITGLLGDMHNKMLLEGDINVAQTVGDTISQITRSYWYINDELTEDEEEE